MEASSRSVRSQDPRRPHRDQQAPRRYRDHRPQLWAVSAEDGDDGLTTYTLMAGPGIDGVIAAR